MPTLPIAPDRIQREEAAEAKPCAFPVQTHAFRISPTQVHLPGMREDVQRAQPILREEREGHHRNRKARIGNAFRLQRHLRLGGQGTPHLEHRGHRHIRPEVRAQKGPPPQGPVHRRMLRDGAIQEAVLPDAPRLEKEEAHRRFGRPGTEDDEGVFL